MRILFAVILAFLTACGPTFSVGDTEFLMIEDAEAWPDLPEAMAAMQQLDTPEDMWCVSVLIYPIWHPIGKPGHACSYDPLVDQIRLRPNLEKEPTTADGCLPHELAHRWDHLQSGSAIGLDHDEVWGNYQDILIESAQTTWAHR